MNSRWRPNAIILSQICAVVVAGAAAAQTGTGPAVKDSEAAPTEAAKPAPRTANDPELMIQLYEQRLKRDLAEVSTAMEKLRQGRELAASDVRSWPELARRLEEASAQKTTPAGRLWGLLTDATKKAAAALQRNPTAATEQTTLLDGLHSLLERRDLAREIGILPGGVLDNEAQALLGRGDDLTAGEVRRRNRLLLELIFSQEIARTRPEPALLAELSTKTNAAKVALYPPAEPAGPSKMVRLKLTIPQLAPNSVLPVYIERGERIVFSGSDPQFVALPNTGALHYRYEGERGFSHSVIWDPETLSARGSNDTPQLERVLSF